MPELPEVETIRLGLSRLAIGLPITKLKIYAPKSFVGTKKEIGESLLGSNIREITRRGKLLIFGLSSGWYLAVHLKMTGQLVYRGTNNFGGGHPTDSLIGKLPDKSTRVMFDFKNGSKLFFNDQRKFGWIKLLSKEALDRLELLRKLGPEPLEKSFSSSVFIERVNKRAGSTIKATLLDQTVIAGVGNIYADESLFLAKIHPSSRVKAIPKAKLMSLRDSIVQVLTLSLESGGSTDRNYVDAEGNKGSYLKFAKVFRRNGQPCLNCGTEIIKIRVAGRGTHLCPVCQRL